MPMARKCGNLPAGSLAPLGGLALVLITRPRTTGVIRLERWHMAGLLLVLAFASPGCGPASLSDGSDGGQRAVDGGVAFFDASFYEDGGAQSDSGLPPMDASMDGGVVSCGGACRPTAVSVDCGADICALTSAEPACVSSVGGLAAGDPCTDPADCGPGLACFKKGAAGICGVICCAAEGDVGCAMDERCGGPGLLVDDTSTNWAECLPRRACDALAGTGCELGEGCYFTDAGGLTDCREEGAAVEGEACSVPEDCAAGMSCLGLSVSTCRVICDGEEDCSGGQTCVDAAFPGLPGVGHCA